MAGKGNKKFRLPKRLLPSPKTIAKRGLYELMWRCQTSQLWQKIKGGKILTMDTRKEQKQNENKSNNNNNNNSKENRNSK